MRVTANQVKAACLVAAVGGLVVSHKHHISGLIVAIVATLIRAVVWSLEEDSDGK
jgi:hypothetical protein